MRNIYFKTFDVSKFSSGKKLPQLYKFEAGTPTRCIDHFGLIIINVVLITTKNNGIQE